MRLRISPKCIVPFAHHLINSEFPSTSIETSPNLQQGNFAALPGAHQGSSGGQFLQNVFDRPPFHDAPATTGQPPENRLGPGGGAPFGSYGGAGLVPFSVIDRHSGMFHQHMHRPASSGHFGSIPGNPGPFGPVAVDQNPQRPRTPATPAHPQDHPSVLQDTPGRRHSVVAVLTASEPDEDGVKDRESRAEDNTGDTTVMEDVVGPPKMYPDLPDGV